ncbi:transcriptional regulator [Streptomyces sp. NPDC087300]|uniref:transcriptional regulator n=1 Tax=Streptomyces sp. NPDC087300 TaxID=3365780 RepID=UPI00381CD31C
MTTAQAQAQAPATATSPMLLRLAAEHATGVLLRGQGTLYLADGSIVHAESPAAPGLDVLLTAGGVLPRQGWEEALTEAGTRNEVGRHLVDSGRVAAGELELCHLGALFDAAYFVLGPAGGPTRFRYGVAHWLGRVRPVPVAAVDRESRRRRALLDGIWPDAAIDEAPVVPRPPAPGQSVTARQRAVLRLADGVRTPTAIAWALGRPAFHTLVEVRRLAAAGLVSTPRARASPEPRADPAWAEEIHAAVGVSADPDIDLLRRLRDALEASL